METAALFVVVLGIFSGLTSGIGVLPDIQNAALGGTAIFTTNLNPTEEPFVSINWKFGEKEIITSGVSNVTGADYVNRITLFPSTGSLELRSLVLSDSGEYRVYIAPNGEPAKSGSVKLQVYVPVSNVRITSSGTDFVEFKHQVTLSCEADGTSLFFNWMNGSSLVTASDRVQITNGGSTVVITNVTRYDHGQYVCEAFNSVNMAVSSPVNLSISYGPENTDMRFSPSQEYFNEGSNISVLCSADSRPAASFDWFFNGEELPDTGPELMLTNLNMNHSGNYSCLAANSKTLLDQTSPSLPVSVLERIINVSVTSSTNQAIEGNTVNLTCDAAGDVFTREWMKDGLNLTQDDNIKLYEEDRVLSFKRLTKNDTGEYSCNVSNPLTNVEARHNLTVNYGPENVLIKGPSEVSLGQSFTLACSAESTPSATYTWTWNETEISHVSEYIHNYTEVSSSGNYTCTARNRITGRTTSAVHELTVSVTENGLSAGAIAGIVIACLVVVALFGVGGFFIHKKFSSKPESLNTSSVQLQPQQQQQQQQQQQPPTPPPLPPPRRARSAKHNPPIYEEMKINKNKKKH